MVIQIQMMLSIQVIQIHMMEVKVQINLMTTNQDNKMRCEIKYSIVNE